MRNNVPAQQLLSSEITVLIWVCLKWNFLRISDLWAIWKTRGLEHQSQISERTQNWKLRILHFQQALLLMEEKLKW